MQYDLVVKILYNKRIILRFYDKRLLVRSYGVLNDMFTLLQQNKTF